MKEKKSTSSILAVVLTIFVVILAWYVVAPGYKIAKQEKADLDGQVISLQEKLAWLEEAKSGLKSSEATFSKLLVSVPSEGKDESNAISELEAIALKHSLVIPSISFSDLSSDSFDADGGEVFIPGSRVSIALVLEGSFDNISSFMESVENSVKFMNVRSFTFATSETFETSLSLEIEAYTQNTDSEVF